MLTQLLSLPIVLLVTGATLLIAGVYRVSKIWKANIKKEQNTLKLKFAAQNLKQEQKIIKQSLEYYQSTLDYLRDANSKLENLKTFLHKKIKTTKQSAQENEDIEKAFNNYSIFHKQHQHKIFSIKKDGDDGSGEVSIINEITLPAELKTARERLLKKNTAWYNYREKLYRTENGHEKHAHPHAEHAEHEHSHLHAEHAEHEHSHSHTEHAAHEHSHSHAEHAAHEHPHAEHAAHEHSHPHAEHAAHEHSHPHAEHAAHEHSHPHAEHAAHEHPHPHAEHAAHEHPHPHAEHAAHEHPHPHAEHEAHEHPHPHVEHAAHEHSHPHAEHAAHEPPHPQNSNKISKKASIQATKTMTPRKSMVVEKVIRPKQKMKAKPALNAKKKISNVLSNFADYMLLSFGALFTLMTFQGVNLLVALSTPYLSAGAIFSAIVTGVQYKRNQKLSTTYKAAYKNCVNEHQKIEMLNDDEKHIQNLISDENQNNMVLKASIKDTLTHPDLKTYQEHYQEHPALQPLIAPTLRPTI